MCDIIFMNIHIMWGHRRFILIFHASTTRKFENFCSGLAESESIEEHARDRNFCQLCVSTLVLLSKAAFKTKKRFRTHAFWYSRTHPTGHARVNSRISTAASDACTDSLHSFAQLATSFFGFSLAITWDTFTLQRPVIARRLFVFIIFFFFFFPS